MLLLSHFSRVQLCATPWTAAYQAPPSMGFSRQEYWSGVSLPSPGTFIVSSKLQLSVCNYGEFVTIMSSDFISSCFISLIPLLLLLSRFSHVQLCATPWTAAHQSPPSMGFSRQEYWSGVPLPSPTNATRPQ